MEKLIAQTNVPLEITPPAVGISASTGVGTIVSNVFTIIFIIAVLIVVFMLVIGAFQWIMSGGDKEAVGNARKRITHALIGLAILSLAWFIVTIVGGILGINVLNITKTSIPTLSNTTNLLQ